MPYLCSFEKTNGEGARPHPSDKNKDVARVEHPTRVEHPIRAALRAAVLGAVALGLMAQAAGGQANAPSLPAGATAPTATQVGPSSYQGSVPAGEATAQTVDLTLDEAIARGLRNNLGGILSGTTEGTAEGGRVGR